MKFIIPLLFTFSVLLNTGRSAGSNIIASFSDSSKSLIKRTFISCFKDIDTTKICRAVSCSWGTYKLISKKYILRIRTQAYASKINSCYDISIDGSKAKELVELLVYEKNDATLDNICTDLGDLNNPRPTRRFYAQSGRVLIGYTPPKNNYDQFDISILLKNIIFIDPATKEKIGFNNELIWKVFFDGIPG